MDAPRSRRAVLDDDYWSHLPFCLGLAHHVLISYVTMGISATTGWYLYALVVEVTLIARGLLSWLPERLHRAVLPAAAACFAALELYATHFVLLPYYTGLIAHTPGGAIATFHPFGVREPLIATVAGRLAANKPAFLGPPLIVALWIGFVLGTVAVVWISIRARRQSEDQANEVPFC